jgi:hypothetical protein
MIFFENCILNLKWQYSTEMTRVTYILILN